jgi:hypothetical protein
VGAGQAAATRAAAGIDELLCTADRSSLRLACSSARALVNSRVAGIELLAGELIGRPLRLHERFPRLEVLQLLDAPDGALTDSAFADFAVAELARLASMTELDLRYCKSLGTAAVGFLHQCCPQLQGLNLAGTGGSSPQQCCSCCASLRCHLRKHPFEQCWHP